MTFIKPSINLSRIPLAPILTGLFALLMIICASGVWILTPAGPQYAIESWQGRVTLAAGIAGILLFILRLRGLRDRYYFTAAFVIGATAIAMPVWFIFANDVIGLSGKVDPATLDPTRNRADSGLKATLVAAIPYSLLQWLHLMHSSLLRRDLIAKAERLDLLSAQKQPASRATSAEVEPAMRPDETLLRSDMANLHGWLLCAPRLARLFVTSQRVVFVPPGTTWRYALFSWTVGLMLRANILRPPLGQPLQIELRDVDRLWDRDTTFPDRAWISDGTEAWGYQLFEERPPGRSAVPEPAQHEHFLLLEDAWRKAAPARYASSLLV